LLKALLARLAEKPDYRLMGLGFQGEKAPPGLEILAVAPRRERVWLWDQLILPLHLLRARARVFHSCASLGPLKEVNYPIPWVGRSVLTVHDWNLYAEDASPLERFYRETRRLKTQKRFLRHAAAVVADAECVAEETRDRGRVPASRIVVIRPGGDHLDGVAEAPYSGKPGFVLSVGDGPHKGLDTAYRALVRAREQGMDREWIVIGDPERVRQAADAGPVLPEWVRIFPAMPDAELKGLYRAALCLLFPSRREGFGFPLLEAMRLGCPVLAADVEPLRGLVGSGESLQQAGDAESFTGALLRLGSQDALQRDWAEKGRARSQAYTWATAAEQVLSLWKLIFPPSQAPVP
jgi:glycosyltransferase involved in cell wall biosynthesis